MIDLRASLRFLGRPSVRTWLLTTLAASAMTLILFGHALPLQVVLRAMDVTHLNTPIKERIALSLLGGELPLWNESVGCGVPFLANPMTQSLYPGNLLFLFTDSIRGMKIFILAHFVFMVIAFRVLAREFQIRGVAALLGGLLFAGSGAVVSIHWSVIWTAGLPWMLLAMALTRRMLRATPTRGTILRLASVVLMIILASAFELLLAYAWYTVLECGLAWWSRRSRPDGLSLPVFSMRVGLLGLSGLIALGVAACQILPTYELVTFGSRHGGVGSSEASIWSLSPLRLLAVLAPGLLGDPATDGHWGAALLDTSYDLPYLNGVYLGAPAVILAILGLLTVSRRDRLLLGAITLVTVLMAFGSATFIFELCRKVIPGVAYFRYPIKIFICTMIPVCLLAAAGAQSLLGRDRVSIRPPSLPGWLVTVVLGACLLSAVIFQDRLIPWISERVAAVSLDFNAGMLLADARGALAHGLVVAVIFALLLHCRSRLPERVLAGCLLVLVPAELAYANRPLVTTQHVAQFLRPPAALPRRADFVERSGTTRIGSVIPGQFTFFYPPYLASFHGYRSALDYGAMEVRHGAVLRSTFPDQCDRRFAICSVRYKLTVPPGHVNQDYMRAERLEDSVPRASLVPRASVALEETGAVWYIQSPGFDPQNEVVLLDAPRELARRGRPAASGELPRISHHPPAAVPYVATASGEKSGLPSVGSAVMTRDSSREVVLEIDAHRDAFLVLTDTWYPGWEAWLDDRPVPHYRANIAFRALPVPAGQHTVRFVYRPASVAWGFGVSGLTVAGVIVWLVVAARRKTPYARGKNTFTTVPSPTRDSILKSPP